MFSKTLAAAWLVAGLMGATAVRAGNHEPGKLQMRAQRSYLLSLSSEHACIRNSAIFWVMQYRARFPQDDVGPFVKALRGMSMNDAFPQNRFYAFMACTFLEGDKLMQAAGLPPRQEDEKEKYFARLHEILLGSQ